MCLLALFSTKGTKGKQNNITSEKSNIESNGGGEKKRLLKPALNKSAKPKKAKVLPPFVTIDIGSYEVKIMAANYKNGRLTINQALSTILRDGAVEDGRIIDEDYVTNCIRGMIENNRMKVSGAVITMNSSEIIQREIVVPKVPNNELQGLVTFEVGKYLPINPASYSIQYNVVEEFENENNITSLRINVSAMPRTIAKKYLDIVTKLKLKPIALDLHSNSVAKLISVEAMQGSPLGSGSNIVIDMGHTNFNIMMFDEGKFVFNRLIETGGSKLDDIIIRIADVTPVEASKLKKYNLSKLSALDIQKTPSATSRHDDFYNTSTDTFDKEALILQETMLIFNSWISDIDGISKYYLSRNKENRIDGIYIYSGSSYIKDIDKLIESRLNIKTRRLNYINCIQGILDSSNEGIPKYMNNIGATIRL